MSCFKFQLVDSPLRAWVGNFMSGHTKPPTEIDEIKPHTAGRLNLSFFDVETAPIWLRSAYKILTATDARGWCGLVDIPKPSSMRQIRSAPQDIIEKLRHSIIEPSSTTTQGYVLNSMFLVPKNETISRVILDCRTLNELCAKPPHVAFAPMTDIFEILRFFNSAYLVTGDFRHWFYQIPLAPALRGLFSFKDREDIFRLKVWAMGFSWSPFISQSLSMELGRRAIELQSGWFAIPSGESLESPPPFWIISIRQTDSCSLSKNDIIGFLTFWYDNLFACMDSEANQMTMANNMKLTAKGANAEWKLPKGEVATHKDAFTYSHEQVDFLGICFTRGSHADDWLWHHLHDSIESWKKLSSQTKTWRLAAQLVGIITWDWTVSNTPRGTRKEVFDIARIIGLRRLEGPQWDFKTDSSMGDKQWETLLGNFELVIANEDRHQYRRIAANYSRTTYIASDAMKDQGAMVWLDNPTVEKYETIRYDNASTVPPREVLTRGDDLSINWKETFTAIRALEIASEGLKPFTHIRIGVDNTSAVSVLTRRSVLWCEQLDKRIHRLVEQFTAQRLSFSVHYLPGSIQAADERSRGRTSNVTKCQECLTYLRNIKIPLWERLLQATPQGGHQRCKRRRTERQNLANNMINEFS